MYTPRFSAEQDVGPSGWLTRALTSFSGRAADLTTREFEAWVRIFHRPDQGLPDPDSPHTWAEVARRRGTRLHPAVQWNFLSGHDPQSSGTGDERSLDGRPLVGSLDRLTLPLLQRALQHHTTTPDLVWLALWHGTGKQASAWMSAPTFSLPGREYWLFRGALASVVEHAIEFESAGDEERADGREFARMSREAGCVQSPHLWWPEDRAWVVVSEIDYDSTLVAGTQALAEALLEHPDIECLEVSPDTSLYFDADVVNRRE